MVAWRRPCFQTSVELLPCSESHLPTRFLSGTLSLYLFCFLGNFQDFCFVFVFMFLLPLLPTGIKFEPFNSCGEIKVGDGGIIVPFAPYYTLWFSLFCVRLCGFSLSFLLICVISRTTLEAQESICSVTRHFLPLNQASPSWVFRNLSHGSVNLVISQGNPRFETHEEDPPPKHKWLTKKRLKMKRMREKQKRNAANKRDPRCLGVTRKKKMRFANAEERINYKLEKVIV